MQRSSDFRSVAKSIIAAKSFRRGSIRLASGKISEYYLDMKPTMFDPKGALALSNLVIERLKELKVDRVGGLEMGAVPLIANVAMLSAQLGHPLPGFFVRKAVKDHGTKKLVEGSDDLSGKRVAILDDVTTSGASAMIAVNAAKEAGAEVVLVLSVVDRKEGAPEFYKNENIAFDSLFTKDDFLK